MANNAQAEIDLKVKPGTYKRLMGYVKPYWLAFLVGVVGIAMYSSVDASFAYLVKPLLNKGMVQKDPAFIAVAPYYIIGLFIARGVFNFLSTFFIGLVSSKVVMRLRQIVFGHYLDLPSSYYDKHSSGKMLSAIIYNISQVSDACTNALIIMTREGCLAAGLIVVMLFNSWKLTAIFLLAGPFIIYIAKVSSKLMRRYSHSTQISMGELTSIAEEGIEGYKVVRTYGGQQYEQAKFDEVTHRNYKQMLKIIGVNAISSPLVAIIAGFAIVVIIQAAMAIQINTGTMVSMVVAMLAIIRPLKQLTRVNKQVQMGLAAAESVFEILDSEIEIDTGTKQVKRAEGHIRYHDICFQYEQGDKQVLSNVDINIKPKQTVALVGSSGGGKTTLVHLLPRFYDVDSGKITLDDIDVRDYTLESLRSQMAMVSQHVTLFNDSIANNIAYGLGEEVSREAIEHAAKVAHVMEFVGDLPNGLNTEIGDNGLLLSGGQRQRIAIARAVLKDAPVLILDEATSALDTESERHIQAALADLMKQRTTLVIAHRLSTIEKADKIVVIENGKIAEVGDHKTLLQQKGRYARLHKLQYDSEHSFSEVS